MELEKTPKEAVGLLMSHCTWGTVFRRVYDPIMNTLSFSFYENFQEQPAEPVSNFRMASVQEIAIREKEAAAEPEKPLAEQPAAIIQRVAEPESAIVDDELAFLAAI